MASFINNVCYHWKRDTANSVHICLIGHDWQANCLCTITYPVFLPGGLLRCMWSRNSCFAQMLIRAIGSLRRCLFLWSDNKQRVSFDSRTKLPTSGEFCQFQDPQTHILDVKSCFLACCYHFYRNEKDRTLLCTLQKILHLIQGSLCLGSHWFQTSLPSVSHHTPLHSLEQQSVWGSTLGPGYE